MGGIFKNFLQIYDEIAYCGPKNHFYKNLWGNYEALVAQIKLTSY
jgi:hypothetical protein